MKIIGTERDYQRYIIDYLIENNGYIERKCKTNYDRTTAMDRELLFRFLDTTQPDTMAALRKIYNGQTEETIVKFILQSIDNKGSSLIETLKSGIEISNMHLDLLYSKPATDYNIDLVAKYNANIFSIMEEVWINDDQRIDLVVFMNGFAIVTFELKARAQVRTTAWQSSSILRTVTRRTACFCSKRAHSSTLPWTSTPAI